MKKLFLLLFLPSVVYGQDRKSRLLQLMAEADIPGMSLAHIKNGKVNELHHLGFVSSENKLPVNDSTVFAAASLSKTVFAYGVMKLVESGRLHLDTPLYRYLEYEDLKHDDRYRLVTTRQVLSHTSGLPNWRNGELLIFRYNPAERFSYSGEGFVFLQKVVEKITSMPIEAWMKENVFIPLKMTRTSYVWQPAYSSNFALPHVELGRTVEKYYPDQANTAHSLQTTAVDYAKFLVALVNGDGIKKETWQAMFRSQPNTQFRNFEKSLAWGLGIGYGTTPAGISFWQWGDNGPFKALVVGYPERKEAVVYFANSLQGLSIAGEVMSLFVNDDQPELRWLGYTSQDRAGYQLLKRSVAMPFKDALSPFINGSTAMPDTSRLSESQLNFVAGRLLRFQRFDDAINAFETTLKAFPSSARAWEGIGRVHLRTGKRTEAASAFRRAYELDTSRRYLISAADGLMSGSKQPPADGVKFSLAEFPFARAVQLIGSFNDWNDIATPMHWKDGAWTVTLALKPGEYNYKFLVDGVAIPDPKNKKVNTENNLNSVIEVKGR